MRGVLLAGAASVLASAAGCGDNVLVDKTAACRLGARASASTIQDRKIIGLAAPYAPDLELAARDADLEASIAERRAAAWQVVARVLSPVPLAEPRLEQQLGYQPAIPAWHTWYARNDFERVFKKLYRDLGPDGRRARAPIDAAAGFAWNATALDDDPAWQDPQRYLDYVDAIDTAEEVAGVGGASRVGYSPGAMGHLVRSYARLHRCRLEPPPDPYAHDPMRPGQLVVEAAAADVGACEWRALGPFQAGDADVVVTTRGDGDADLYVRRGAPPTADAFDCRSQGDASDEACTVSGGGPIYVAIFGAAASRAEARIEYLVADVVDPPCLDGAMPRDAVLVKADWRRHLPGEVLPTYDSSGARMAARLAGGATWDPDGSADPAPADIYTVQLPSGARFRLPALHVMTKELDHWVWITLWWSPEPDGDFGADRPAAIAALPGPWRNYKMCVATSYLERDPDPRGGLPGSLGDALAAVRATAGAGGPSWCSNPYLEQGPGNAGTNCIGCHQHGGTTLTAEAILAGQPHHGATRVRNNFFTDYLWAIQGGTGEDLSSIVQAEVDYWDANDP